jgi:hypothetical protein
MTESSLAPDASFAAADGRMVRLRQYRGRPVLLVFLRWLG